MLAIVHDEQKTKPSQKFFAKNKSVESTNHETSLPDAASREISIEKTDEGSKAEKRKFQDVWKSKFSWLIYDSSKDVMNCDFCRKAGPDI